MLQIVFLLFAAKLRGGMDNLAKSGTANAGTDIAVRTYTGTETNVKISAGSMLRNPSSPTSCVVTAMGSAAQRGRGSC